MQYVVYNLQVMINYYRYYYYFNLCRYDSNPESTEEESSAESKSKAGSSGSESESESDTGKSPKHPEPKPKKAKESNDVSDVSESETEKEKPAKKHKDKDVKKKEKGKEKKRKVLIFWIYFASTLYWTMYMTLLVTEERIRASTGWWLEGRLATKTLHHLPHHEIIYFLSTSLPATIPLSLGRTWLDGVKVCPESIHGSETKGDGESRGNQLTQIHMEG